jgi:hypothetical protein
VGWNEGLPGSGVGAVEGLAVGRLVGKGLGFVVDEDGTTVGAAEGTDDGIDDGAVEGTVEGREDGTVVGVFVGADDGSPVGTAEGTGNVEKGIIEDMDDQGL